MTAGLLETMQDMDVYSSMEVFDSYFAFFDTMARKSWNTSLYPYKARLLCFPSVLCWHGCGWDLFSMMLSQSRVIIIWRVLFSLFSRLFFSWSCNYRDQNFIGAFYCLYLLAFLDHWLLQLQVWAFWDKKKTHWTQHLVIIQVPNSPASLPFPLCLSESFYVCFMYKVQRHLIGILEHIPFG